MSRKRLEGSGGDSWASSVAARHVMQGNRRRDTKPELRVRRILHRRGLRYRVDAPPLNGLRRRADVLFTRAKVAVFIDGCYWHGCPEHGTTSKTNPEYWTEKIRANIARDRDTNDRLREAGWTVLRFWEHEDPEAVAESVDRTVRSRTDTQGT